MSLTWYTYNFVDSATITATNEDSDFPVTNLQDHRRTKVFRSTTASSVITFDLKSRESVDSIVITENPKFGFGFTGNITVEANATNEWSSPAFTATIDASDDINKTHGFAYKEFSAQEYRFWRLSFSGSSYVEVSNIFIGSKWSMTDNDIGLQWSYQDSDIVDVTENAIGQRFFTDRGKQKTIRGSINYMNATELDQFLQLYDHNRILKPFYIRWCDGIVNDVDRFSGFYFMANKPEIINSAPALYNVSIELVEAK